MRRLRKILLAILLLVVALLAVGLLTLKLRYGGRTVPFASRATPPVLPASALQVAAVLDEAPGNLAVSAGGRLFFNYHPEGRPAIKVAEWTGGRAVPWPNEELQRQRGPDEPYFDQVFSLRIDRQNRLWTLDMGFHGLRQPRVLAFDVASGRLVHRWDIPRELTGLGSYVQDMQIDPQGRYVYIADLGALNGHAAILAYDSRTGRGRRLLEDHPSVLGKPYVISARGKVMDLLGGLYKMHPHIDPITLDRRGEWLYYGPMSGARLYRIRARDLNDPALAPAALAARVEDYGPKNQCDGITSDVLGNIYLTSIEQGAIDILTPKRRLSTLLRSDRIRWPDGMSYGPDGFLYFTDSDIPDVMMKPKSHIRASAPFYIFRFKAPAPGIAGQ
jgi:sugar lactone lactonase YvrE